MLYRGFRGRQATIAHLCEAGACDVLPFLQRMRMPVTCLKGTIVTDEWGYPQRVCLTWRNWVAASFSFAAPSTGMATVSHAMLRLDTPSSVVLASRCLENSSAALARHSSLPATVYYDACASYYYSNCYRRHSCTSTDRNVRKSCSRKRF